MGTKTKVVWKEEDNAELNKILNLLNIILAFCVILTPLITSLMCLIGIGIDFGNVLLIIFLVFMIMKILHFSINWRFIKFRKPDVLEILATALFVMLCVTEIINSIHSFIFVFILGFFCIFLIFKKIDKKYYKALIYTFILTMVVCSIMGVCDLNNSYMPGFDPITFPMSMQFWNPNYSAYITIMAIIMIIYVLSTYKTKLEQIIFWISYVVLNVALFINGCFSAETALFVGLIFLLIYLWIKNKKCPYIILICLGITIASSFVWIKGYSTSGANYMFEFLAVIDGNLGTTLTKDVSTFFDKLFGTGIIEHVAGSDGWNRGDFKLKAWNAIIQSPRSVLFGYGTTYNNNILVHNVLLQIWLEYGVINLALYLSIWVVLMVRFFKTKFTSHNIYLIALIIAIAGVCHYFACLERYSFSYFMCFFTVFVKSINEKYLSKAKNSKEEILKKD